MNNTMGEFCEYCKPGSYGNATTEQGNNARFGFIFMDHYENYAFNGYF